MSELVLGFLPEGLVLFEKRVLFQLLPVGTCRWVFLEHRADEVLELWRHLLRVLHLLVENQRSQFLVRVGIVRGPACEQLINDASEGPDIDFFCVFRLADDLGRKVKRSPFHGLQEVGGCRHLLCESEIANLDVILLDQNVLRLEVPVNDPVLVQIEHCLQYLHRVIFHLLQRELLLLLNHSRKVPTCIVCHDNYLLRSLDHVFQTNHVRVVYFLEKLILLPQIL